MSAYEVETEGRLLLGLLLLVVFLFCSAAAHISKWLFDSLRDDIAGALHSIPFGIGKHIANGIVGLAAPVSQALGRAAQASDTQVGKFFHGMASVAVQVFDAVEAVAMLTVSLTYYAASKASILVTGKTIHYTWSQVQTQAKRAGGLATRVAHIEATVAHAESGAIGRAISRALNPVQAEVRTLTHAIAVEIPYEIGALRDRAGQLERAYEALRARVHALGRDTVGITAAALTAVAIERLGISWVRCSRWKQLGKNVCGPWGGLLDMLLLDAFEAFLVADLCDFISLLNIAVAKFEPLLLAFVDVEDALIGCRGMNKPPDFSLPAFDAPTVTAGLSLA